MIRPRRVSWPLTGAMTLAALLAFASLAVLASREATLGRDQLSAAEDDAAHGDWGGAIAHARGAAEARAPGSPWPARGARRLDDLAREAELRGDDDTALVAYGALRAAALSTGAPGSSETAWRAAAEEGIARIASRRATAAGPTDPRRAATPLETRSHDEPPLSWTLAALSGAVFAMIGALSYLTLAGPDRRWTAAAQTVFAGGLLAYAVVLLMN